MQRNTGCTPFNCKERRVLPLSDTFDRLVQQGAQRLGRTWLETLATGTLAGMEVCVCVKAYPTRHRQAIESARHYVDALHTGRAPLGHLDWLRWLTYMLAGNVFGGLIFVTALRRRACR